MIQVLLFNLIADVQKMALPRPNGFTPLLLAANAGHAAVAQALALAGAERRPHATLDAAAVAAANGHAALAAWLQRAKGWKRRPRSLFTLVLRMQRGGR